MQPAPPQAVIYSGGPLGAISEYSSANSDPHPAQTSPPSSITYTAVESHLAQATVGSLASGSGSGGMTGEDALWPFAVVAGSECMPPPQEPPLGLTVRDLDQASARRFEIPPSIRGVVVSRMDPAGAAFVPAMRRGFVIMEINRHSIHSVADYGRIMSGMRPGAPIAVYGYDPSVGERVLLTATMDAR